MIAKGYYVPSCITILPKINVLKHHEVVGHLSTKNQMSKNSTVNTHTHTHTLMRSFSRSHDGKLISQLSYLYGPMYVCEELCVFSCASTCFGLVIFVMVL
jgi:hypothetical protein